MNRSIMFLTLFASIIFTSFCEPLENDYSDSTFFSELELLILKDYQLCTGDSSVPSRKALLKWKSESNFITESENYSQILKKYEKETGLNPSDVRPCEIVNWATQQLRIKNETALLLEQSKKKILSKKADSLYVHEELRKNRVKPFHFNNIPFGITRKGFLLLADQYGIKLTDEGASFIGDSITVISQTLKGQFHFDSDDKFTGYELESQTGSLDSLDRWIRPLADTLASFMSRKIGTSSDHTYRIGRFDITQGKLAVYKIWNLPDATIYVGLATYNYRYYAKLIVTSKLKDMKKDTVEKIQKY